MMEILLYIIAAMAWLAVGFLWGFVFGYRTCINEYDELVNADLKETADEVITIKRK